MLTVLGSSGFVGEAISRRLREEGMQVSGLARPGFDLTRPETLAGIPEDTEVLIHAAAVFAGEVPEDELWRTNVASTGGLVTRLNALPRLRRVIYLSSGAVYGDQTGMITTATQPRPNTSYGISKWLTEQWLMAGLKVPCTAVRLFFPFGPNQRPGRLIPQLAAKILQSEPVTLNGEEGGPAINPIAVDDVCTVLSGLIHATSVSPFVNAGGEAVVTIRELAEMIGELTGRKPAFQIVSPTPGNLYCRPRQPLGMAGKFRRQLQEALSSGEL